MASGRCHSCICVNKTHDFSLYLELLFSILAGSFFFVCWPLLLFSLVHHHLNLFIQWTPKLDDYAQIKMVEIFTKNKMCKVTTGPGNSVDNEYAYVCETSQFWHVRIWHLFLLARLLFFFINIFLSLFFSLSLLFGSVLFVFRSKCLRLHCEKNNTQTEENT